MDLPSIAEQAERPSVSTGHLPETVRRLVSGAHERFKSNTDRQNSQNSQVYPALAIKAPSSARAGPQRCSAALEN
jgi:glutaminase